MSEHGSAASGIRGRARAWLGIGASGRSGATALRRAIAALTASALVGVFGPIAAQPVGAAGAAFAREPLGAEGRADWAGGVLMRGQLPGEARGTLNLIAAGGPYPYAKDGAVFGNFERLLPARPRGYYHEYTVSTQRARNRGARRIVCGGPPRRTDNCFYTGDHYNSFKRIVE